MYTLRSLLSLTLIIAIIFALWVLGEPTEDLTNPQKAKFAVTVMVLSFIAFLGVLGWIRAGERANTNQKTWITVAIDAVAFLGTGVLLGVVCRLTVNVLLK
ncbi:MAG: hypothetical protein HKN47_02870 [Pirellulaceae bacterium]|nr:hypothetical protein [Pirellulaceae bacterium]